MDDQSNKTKITDLFGGNDDSAKPGKFGATDNMGTNISQVPGQTGASNASMQGVNDDSTNVSNPFTGGELKSDMTSQLSVGVSNFSEYFKSGMNPSQKRILAMVLVTVLILGGLFVYKKMSVGGDGDDFAAADYSPPASSSRSSSSSSSSSSSNSSSYDDDSKNDQSGSSSSDMTADSSSSSDDDYDDDYDQQDYDEDDAMDEDMSSDSYGSDDSKYDDSKSDVDEMSASEEIVLAEATGGEGAPRIVSPENNQSRNYDETSEYAQFEWQGEPGGHILFSRSYDMQPLEKKISVSENYYRLAHPWPGTWYWRVENSLGMSAVKSFYVEAPVRRQIALNPLGEVLSGTGGVVSWQGDSKVARYVIELSQSGWSNPQFKFQTSGTSLTLNNVSSGDYQIRLGAFSEVSGRWEYTQAQAVSIQ